MITSRNGIPNVVGEFYSKLYADPENHQTRWILKRDQAKKENNTMSATRRKCLRSLLTRYSQQTTNSTKGKLATTTESELNASRTATTWRKKWWDRSTMKWKKRVALQKHGEEYESKLSTKKRKRRRRQELPPNLYSASAVQTVHDNSPQQIMLQAWLATTRRSRRVPSILPNTGPPDHVQTYQAEKPRVMCQNVACNDWHREGI